MNYLYNNFLTPTEVDKIHDIIFNINFPWFYAHENTVSQFVIDREQKNFTNLLDYYQMCHVFYSDYSKYSYIPKEIIDRVNLPNKILRAKVNLQSQNINATTETFNCPHQDMDEPHLAGIYYVNDSNGFTFLFDNDNDNNKIIGFVCKSNKQFFCKQLILTTGTFLNGMIHMGEKTISAGRVDEPPSISLANDLRSFNLKMGRI